MRVSWGAAVLCLGVVSAAADPVPPPVRSTLRTRELLADVQARATTLGIPVDRPGKKLKAAYGKALALLSAEARTFDRDLDSAYKAGRILEKALPEDGDMAALLGTVTTGFGADIAFDAAILRAGAGLAHLEPRMTILEALDRADSAIASAQSLRDFRAASRKLRGPRKQVALTYAGASGQPGDYSAPAIGLPGRPLGAGESFEATGTGMTFQAIGVYPADASAVGSAFLIGGPFTGVNPSTIGGYALYIFGIVDSPLGTPVPVDLDQLPLQVIFSPFHGSVAGVESLSSPDLATGTVTFSELDASTGTWAGSFDLTFQSGHTLAGSFRVSGLR